VKDRVCIKWRWMCEVWERRFKGGIWESLKRGMTRVKSTVAELVCMERAGQPMGHRLVRLSPNCR